LLFVVVIRSGQEFFEAKIMTLNISLSKPFPYFG